ncbi:MAG: PIN domain-containing protein [Candidatus Bathyarchaeia archaeon]
MKEVIDTRFLIEHFYSDEAEVRRKTSKRLDELIRHKRGLLPTIVICEIVKVLCEKLGKDAAETCYLSLVGSGLQIQDLDRNIAKLAGLLKCQHRDVPIGDCVIASTAIVNRARILSDDPHFDAIKSIKRCWI